MPKRYGDLIRELEECGLTAKMPQMLENDLKAVQRLSGGQGRGQERVYSDEDAAVIERVMHRCKDGDDVPNNPGGQGNRVVCRFKRRS